MQCRLALLLCCRYCKVYLTSDDFLLLDLSRQKKKGFNFLIRVSGAGKETSLCMKEVSFWAVAGHELRVKQETIQEESKLKE